MGPSLLSRQCIDRTVYCNENPPSKDVIVGKDFNGVARTWNRGAADMFGYTSESNNSPSVSSPMRSSLKRVYAGGGIACYGRRPSA